MPSAPDQYSQELVLRVNELFYDEQNDAYHPVHFEMLGREGVRWRERARRYFDRSRPLTIVDIGCGAGLVPISISEVLRAGDTMICADISSRMLETARRNLSRLPIEAKLEFVKIAGSTPYHLPFESGSIDVVTMNSALHHVSDTGGFLREIDRVLKPGGLLMIGHEPNRAFVTNTFLQVNYALLKPLLLPKNTMREVVAKLGIYRLISSLYYLAFPKKRAIAGAMMDRINSTLIAERLVDRPLRIEELPAITDVRDAEGFHADKILPGYEILDLDIYNPMHLISIKYGDNGLIAKYDAFLQKKFPREGATFFGVYRKGSMR